MSCSRKHCNNIMCDTYINSVGYICDECKDEFKQYLISEGITVKTDIQIEKELKIFMNVEKNTYSKGNEMSIDDFFNKHL